MSNLVSNFYELLRASGTWLVISFVACGLLRGVLRPEAFQKALGNNKLSSIIKATLSGMLLPICSCGALPLAVGLYFSGAHLGPTLAFLMAAPIINPAAVMLSYALLGPYISTAYLICGLAFPVIIGVAANKFGGKLAASPYASPPKITFEKTRRPPLSKRLLNGLKWGFDDLAVKTCKFIVIGAVLSAILLAAMPPVFIHNYLSGTGLIPVIGVTLLGIGMYTCNFGLIPLVAAFVGAGMSPGIALAFLLSGVSTSLPKLISIWKLIGKRAVFIFAAIVLVFGVLSGYAVNLLFAENFAIQPDLAQAGRTVEIAGYFHLRFPQPVRTASAAAIIVVGLYAWAMYLKQLFVRRKPV